MRRLLVFGLALCVHGIPTSRAAAQDADSLRRAYRLPVDALQQLAASMGGRAAPGTSSGSPSAFGPNFDDGFVGLGYQRHVRRGTYSDASVSAGFGLGNAARFVGLEVDAVSGSTWRTGVGSRTSFGFKLHRLLPDGGGIAVGWENALTVGKKGDGGSSKYLVASKVFTRTRSTTSPFSTVTMSLGLGDGRFRFEDDVRHDRKHVNVFGSLGARVADPAAVFADWTGQDLTVGLSVVPFTALPFTITPAIADVTRTANNRPRFICGAGLAFKFSSVLRGL